MNPIEVLPQPVDPRTMGMGTMGSILLGSESLLGFSLSEEANLLTPEYASNPKVEPPDLKELLSYTKMQVKSEINCISLGTIQDFDSITQTATVKVNFKKVIQGGSPAVNNSGQSINNIVEYPTLFKCPVFVLSGGTSAIHMPITTGDTCLILFCDRDIDQWFVTGQTSPPNSSRLHDLSDGIALVGIKPSISPIEEYIEDGPSLVNTLNGVKSVISAQDKLLLQVGEQTLKDIFSSLISQVKSTYALIQTFYGTVNNLVTHTGDVLNSATKATITAEISDIADAISEFDQITSKINTLFK